MITHPSVLVNQKSWRCRHTGITLGVHGQKTPCWTSADDIFEILDPQTATMTKELIDGLENQVNLRINSSGAEILLSVFQTWTVVHTF